MRTRRSAVGRAPRVQVGRITAVLRSAGELSQADLARHTGLSAATISNIVRELERAGTVDRPDRKGRRRTVRLARAEGFVVGIDYGHRHVSSPWPTSPTSVLAERRMEIDERARGRGRPGAGGELLGEVLDRGRGHAAGQVVGPAIGPARLRSKSPRPRSARRRSCPAGWVFRCVELAKAFDLAVPFAVENDANLGALAEHRWGAGMGYATWPTSSCRKASGAGLILGGRAYGGPSGTAGEIGHMTVDELGEVCRCGNRGCLETLVSARHVVSLLERLTVQVWRSRTSCAQRDTATARVPGSSPTWASRSATRSPTCAACSTRS